MSYYFGIRIYKLHEHDLSIEKLCNLPCYWITNFLNRKKKQQTENNASTKVTWA